MRLPKMNPTPLTQRFAAALLACWVLALGSQRECLGALSTRPSVDLSGTWEFKIDPADVGRAQKWYQRETTFDRRLQVPGAWNAQGVTFDSKAQLHSYEEICLEEQKSLNNLGTLGVQRESERLFSTYPGPGWYRKQVTIPPDWKGKIPWLIFDAVHREAEVWINGKPVGTHISYLVPFRINLSQYAKPGEKIQIVARVDARRRKEVDPLMGCLDTLDFLYITWGGIHGRVRLEATETTRIEQLFVVPQLASESAELRVSLAAASSSVHTLVSDILNAEGVSVASSSRAITPGESDTVQTVHIPRPHLWSPKSPYLYSARVQLLADGKPIDTRSVRFGMREFKVANGSFLLNGKPIFLRGYGDDAIFPNTIAAPVDKKEFRRRLSIARDYGFNYVRHHSWTPPEDYLEAADELGMMLQPEFPFAYRWDLPTTPEAKSSALRQWEEVIRLNRNHPSIVVWCMGNELYDSFDLAPEMYRAAKRLDPTRPVIDSDGCGVKHKDRETLDFMVIQFHEANSVGFQDNKYGFPKEILKPVIAHEMGYFVTLPDLKQLSLFRGGVRPYWLLQTIDSAHKNGVTADYPAWLAASYRLQAASLKSNQEAARRSRLNGTSVWLFQDYPNCAEGVVDMFYRPKGVKPDEFRKFNAPTVLLLDIDQRSWQAGQRTQFKFVVSRFEDAPSTNATLRWQLKAGNEVIASGLQEQLRIHSDGVQELPSIELNFPQRTKAEALTLSAELTDANGKTDNAWSLWVFPTERWVEPSANLQVRGMDSIRSLYPWAADAGANVDGKNTDLIITTRLDPQTIQYLTHGGRVFLLDPENPFAVEKTNFRLSAWDGGGPSGTTLEKNHPALRNMPSEGWCDLQFYPLIQGSKTVLLSPLPSKIQPLVRCIDRPTRLNSLAYLFEARVGEGKLLVSGLNFATALKSNDPASRFLLDQLIHYALGPEFKPKASLPAEALQTKATP